MDLTGFTEFIFETFDEAMNVHKKLFEIRRNNGFVTCADLYLLAHNVKGPYLSDIYNNHGWTNLWNVKVEPYDEDGNWVLKMPQIQFLNMKENLIKKENK